MERSKAGEFLRQSPEDFREKALRLASKYDAMLRSEEYQLLHEFQGLMIQGYLNSLESSATYEEFLQNRADMQAIKKARASAAFLMEELKIQLASPSEPGNPA